MFYMERIYDLLHVIAKCFMIIILLNNMQGKRAVKEIDENKKCKFFIQRTQFHSDKAFSFRN